MNLILDKTNYRVYKNKKLSIDINLTSCELFLYCYNGHADG